MNCECGMHASDPMHMGWHNITMHNRYVFEMARKRREKEFDDTLKNRASVAKGKAMRPVSGRKGSLWAE